MISGTPLTHVHEEVPGPVQAIPPRPIGSDVLDRLDHVHALRRCPDAHRDIEVVRGIPVGGPHTTAEQPLQGASTARVCHY